MHDIRKELKEWSEGKPFPVVLIAQQIVFSADAVIGLLEMLHTDGAAVLRQHPVPRDQWLKLYTRHRSVNRAIVEFLGCTAWDTIEKWRSSLVIAENMPKGDLQDELANMSVETWNELMKEVQQFASIFQELHVEWLLEFDNLDDADLEYIGKHVTSTELQFFFRVVFPCWILHGELPLTLLWRASRKDQPNLEALKSLIALDKKVVHHPCLNRVLHPVDAALERDRLSEISDVGAAPAAKAVKRRTVKYCLAGCLSKLSEMLVHRLNETEIRELFDIVARRKGDLCDPDLPPGKEAFSKGIQRDRKFWKSLKVPDEVFQNAVRALRGAFA